MDNIEKTLNPWCNSWLSFGGNLVLIKFVVESILVYWMYLAWIPKGILEKIQQLCYKFIWLRNQDKKGMTLVYWKNMTIPKGQGCWGLKNIFLFFQILVS